MHVLYCPVGFAHGFCTLSEIADVMYKQDGYYADATERGIKFDDPDVGDRVADPGERAEDVRARPQRAAAARHRGRRCHSSTHG